MTTNQKVGIGAGAAVVVAGIVAALALFGAGVTNVPAGADLQAAINAASTGDTLQLANATYTGNFVENKGLTIIGPAKLVSPNADPAIQYPPATPSATLRNIEITGTWYQIFAIVRYGDQGTIQDTLEEQPLGLTMDNVWVHGFETQEVQNCVTANGRNFKFLNSKATECHMKGIESHGIISWNGTGPFTVLDSRIESSGINIMWGGATPSIPGLVADGIEFRRNVMFKPLSWRGVWTVKNLFEIKNGRNAIIGGNLFENNWTDAQSGWAIQFTPRPSDSGPAAVVEDIQFINNIIRNSGQGINLLGADQAPAPTDVRLHRIRIANNLLENINGPQFGSSGNLFTVTNGADSVTIENNTGIHTGNVIASDYAPSTNFIYRNNISRHNSYGIFGSGQGIGNPTIAFYFPGSTVTGNQLAKEVDAPSNVESLYPAGNSFPATLSAVMASDFRSLVAGVGADIDAIKAAQGGGSNQPTPVPTTTTNPPSGESANNTRVPPSAQIVDTTSAVWTRTSNGTILRNGGGTGGVGSQLLYCTHLVYAFGTDSQWYKWGGSWQAVGMNDPCGGSSPTPTPTVAPTVTPTPAPLPSPSPSPQPSPCQPTPWPNSVQGQNSQMQTRRAQGCWPYNRTNNGMEYRRP